MSVGKEYLRVLGGPGCGKTTAVLEHMRRLSRQGANDPRILVIAPSEQARSAIVGQVDSDGMAEGAVEVVTIHDLCVRILDTEKARRVTGRIPRILNSVEELFFLEDLKVTGVKSRRLQEMLRYLCRCFTEMSDADETFIQDADESVVMDVLRGQLLVRQAMLSSELSATAYRYLRNEPQALMLWRRDCVLVDDYHGLNKASQLLVELLASHFLLVTGDPQRSIRCSEPYPYAQGIADFADTYPNVRTIRLKTAHRTPQRISAIGNAMLLGESPDDALLVGLDTAMPQGRVTQVKWRDSSEELVGIAKYVRNRLADKKGHLKPSEVFVAVPNRLWGSLLRVELERCDVSVASILAPRGLAGDPRAREGSLSMRLFTALCLLSDRQDLVSWRSWLGFGEHLTNSAPWSRLCAYCREKRRRPLELLHEIATADMPSPFIQADRLADAYRLGLRLFDELEGKKGFGLLKALREAFDGLPDEFCALVEPLDGTEDAVDLATRARGRLFDPCFPAGGVRLGGYEMAYCLEPRLVILVGLVNGFIPYGDALDQLVDPARRRRLYREQTQLLHGALMRASEELVLSYFQKEELGRAGDLRLDVRRIRVDHGVRVAVLAPSSCFDEMGPALPGAVSFLQNDAVLD